MAFPMLEIQKNSHNIHKWHHQLVIVLVAGLLWFMTLPTAVVQAAGYYQGKNHNVEIAKPYYATKERKILIETEPNKPYYSTKERKKERVIIKTPATKDHAIESGKGVEQMTHQD
ncbi:hypothetical protein [Umezakia ovalisporum]|uniref:Uncharacterized protein n=2 Tax=Umezakia ovalisporum TaxID=75695 RepID=A0AA43H141_9CYAN|nr:hypothetical protein [Umezakia ovalisporum]MDH6058019.1 hypothetical protein [Umezakia ovalisporum FSS-43]MDH6065168.1 hypothetical protein [Umezakia ovalisporum FSS-62]MDH6066939.1 hypothetical protein [Umezakia ovalisporum APH033B]MDH6072042.1 hypothetical protein [Umezakia ovalisporum CobakiLakeA]MDH6074167.1 hypothetical protein [Umezakia ovalisporum CS-1034]